MEDIERIKKLEAQINAQKNPVSAAGVPWGE